MRALWSELLDRGTNLLGSQLTVHFTQTNLGQLVQLVTFFQDAFIIITFLQLWKPQMYILHGNSEGILRYSYCLVTFVCFLDAITSLAPARAGHTFFKNSFMEMFILCVVLNRWATHSSILVFVYFMWTLETYILNIASNWNPPIELFGQLEV